MTKPAQTNAQEPPEELFGRIVSILEQARGNVVRSVNSNMVWAYWLIGREIVQELQSGDDRAEYGKQVIEGLSRRLNEKYGKGFSTSNLWYFRQFYLAYEHRANIPHPAGGELEGVQKLHPAGGELGVEKDPHWGANPEKGRPMDDEACRSPISHPVDTELLQGFSPQLSWSHYRVLMRVENITARNFYEREAIEGG